MSSVFLGTSCCLLNADHACLPVHTPVYSTQPLGKCLWEGEPGTLRGSWQETALPLRLTELGRGLCANKQSGRSLGLLSLPSLSTSVFGNSLSLASEGLGPNQQRPDLITRLTHSWGFETRATSVRECLLGPGNEPYFDLGSGEGRFHGRECICVTFALTIYALDCP